MLRKEERKVKNYISKQINKLGSDEIKSIIGRSDDKD